MHAPLRKRRAALISRSPCSSKRSSIGLRGRRELRTRSNVSVYFSPTDDGARMTSTDDVKVFNIYY